MKKLTEIRITGGRTSPERYAVKELKKYLSQKGITFSENGFPIRLRIDPALPEDGYRIEVFLGARERMTLTGGNARGVLYGVYAFLERCAGFHFYTPTLEVCDDCDVVVTEGVLAEYAPVIEMRKLGWYLGPDAADWCAKNGINSGGGLGKAQGGAWSYGNLFVHTFGMLMETGHAWTPNPCLSDPANLERTIVNLRRILSEHPEINIASVSQNDKIEYCHCEKCAATDAAEGSPSGTLLRFVNAVAENIEPDFPNVTIDTLAYRYTQKAPAITKPRANVCVRLCSIKCDFTQPLNGELSEENRKLCDDLLEWNKICDNIYIWDYTTNYHHYIPTFPNFAVLRKNMRFYAEHHVKGIYEQGNYETLSGEFGELRAYLLARLMMDPYMSEEEYNSHMNGFLAAYYGAGWRAIRAYIDRTTELSSTHCQDIYKPPFEGIPKEDYEAHEQIFSEYWDEAERLAGDRLECVRRSRMQWRYIQLMLHPNKADAEGMIADAKRWNIAWREWRRYVDPSSDLNTPPNTWSYTTDG